MNNQIKELAEQAGIPKEIVVKESSTYLRDSDAVIRFAELIVKQCADICLEMAAKCGGIPGDGALAKDCAYWIKQHFGVE